MKMIELLQNFGPEIAMTGTIFGVLAPFIRARIVSDKNLLGKFEDIKSMANKVAFKEMELTESITMIDKTVGKIQSEMDENYKKFNETILEFQNGDYMTKMMIGLEQLDELKQTIENKDNIIAGLKADIKEIKKLVG